jgi:CRP/FNR family cyclic AMP-dependent transcriptional regulator
VGNDFREALAPEDLEALNARARRAAFPAGRALLHQGQVPERVFLLLAGRVKVTSATPSGREIVLAFRGPGELVGEQSALDGRPRSATVVTVDAVDALVLTHEAFRAFLAARPEAALALLRMLSLRLRDADAQRVEFATFTTMGRVAARLLDLSERFGREEEDGVRIELPISQEELAGATGSSLESVERALQTMRSLKCVQTRRREIRVLDREALEALRGVA